MAALGTLAPLAGTAPAPPAPTAFVASVAGDAAALDALLTEKLIEAIVVDASERGVLALATASGALTLATAQALPEATRLLLRPAAQPGRVIATVSDGAPPPAATPASAPGDAVALDVEPVV